MAAGPTEDVMDVPVVLCTAVLFIGIAGFEPELELTSANVGNRTAMDVDPLDAAAGDVQVAEPGCHVGTYI